MVKAKVIRGVYIKGTPYPEGAIVEVSDQDFGELLTSHYVVAAPKEEPKPAPVVKQEAGRAAK